jgi:hypothetical protein
MAREHWTIFALFLNAERPFKKGCGFNYSFLYRDDSKNEGMRFVLGQLWINSMDQEDSHS